MAEPCELCMWLAGLHRATGPGRRKASELVGISAGSTAGHERDNHSDKTVEIVDVESSRLIIVSWRDATGGRYGYQTWIRGLARRADVCVLSGHKIGKGDRVFYPRVLGYRTPFNATAMILASQVGELLQVEADVGRHSET